MAAASEALQAEAAAEAEGGRYQLVLLSATQSGAVQRLAGRSLQGAAFVDADAAEALADKQKGSAASSNAAAAEGDKGGSEEGEGSYSAPHQLSQHFMIVPCAQRLTALLAFL